MNHFGATIEVAVDYQLEEYKRVLRDFLPTHFAATGKAPNRLWPWNWPIVETALFNTFVPLVFMLKKHRIGSCVFTFSEAGLSRSSKSGTGNRTWSDIKTVHRLTGAYLIQLEEGGAMPVPYRAFTPEQRDVFESLAQRAGKSAA
jgi:YcxB-like protein